MFQMFYLWVWLVVIELIWVWSIDSIYFFVGFCQDL